MQSAEASEGCMPTVFPPFAGSQADVLAEEIAQLGVVARRARDRGQAMTFFEEADPRYRLLISLERVPHLLAMRDRYSQVFVAVHQQYGHVDLVGVHERGDTGS